jgi:hypothetical protein
MEQVKTQPRPATQEELEALRKQNERFKAERLKKLQAKWRREDESGETEEAIERDRERRREDW